jgi:hypothetical protein
MDEFALFMKFKEMMGQSSNTSLTAPTASTPVATTSNENPPKSSKSSLKITKLAKVNAATAVVSQKTDSPIANKTRNKKKTSKCASNVQIKHLENEPTHALVLWEIDQKHTVVPINYIKKHCNGALIEENKKYKVTWKPSVDPLDATVLSLGTSSSCNKVFELMKVASAPISNTHKPGPSKTIDHVEIRLENEEINLYKVNILFINPFYLIITV